MAIIAMLYKKVKKSNIKYLQKYCEMINIRIVLALVEVEC